MTSSKPGDSNSFCSHCGHRLAPTTNFCQQCGEKVSENLATPKQGSPQSASDGGKWVFVSVLTAIILALGAAALSPASVLDSWTAPSLLASTNKAVPDEVDTTEFPPGYQELDRLWAIDFERPTSCQGDSGSCIRLMIRTAQRCSSISIAYALRDGIESRALTKALTASFDSGRSQTFVSSNLAWQSSRWQTMSVESLECVSNGVTNNSSYVKGRAQSTLRVAEFAPDGFLNAGDRIAYRWADNTYCQSGLRICWNAEVVSAERCQAIVGTFDIEYSSGSVVDSGILAAANTGLAPGEPKVIQFGSPTPIVQADNLQIRAVRFDCLDKKIADTADYAITFSQIDANDILCENQNCQLASSNLSEFERLVELLSQLNGSSGYSGGTGYTVRCADGWISNSGGKQGACSWHGGVAD